MKKNIIGSQGGSKNSNSMQNLLNPQMLEMFSNMMKNNQTQKTEAKTPPKSEEKKENVKSAAETANTVDDELPSQMQLIYNKKLAEIIKNHDKISRRLNRQSDPSAD